MDLKKDIWIWCAGLVYFVVVPLVLVVVFWYSDALKESLVLYSHAPTALSLLGSHYLHTDFAHLASNMLLYLLLMLLVFAFDRRANRQMLAANLLVLLIVLPLVSSLIMVWVFSAAGMPLAGNGFSAVVAGVLGYLAFCTLHFIQKTSLVPFRRNMFFLLWTILFMNLMWICLIYRYLLIALVLGVVILISLLYTYQDYLMIVSLIKSTDRMLRVSFPVLLFCVFYGAVILFPETIRSGAVVVNIFAHYLGYVFGFFVPVLVSVVIVERKK